MLLKLLSFLAADCIDSSDRVSSLFHGETHTYPSPSIYDPAGHVVCDKVHHPVHYRSDQINFTQGLKFKEQLKLKVMNLLI